MSRGGTTLRETPLANNLFGQQTVLEPILRREAARGSSQDYRRFLRMARGSLYETLHWLRRAYMRKLITAKQTEDLRRVVAELSPLNAYLRSVSKSATAMTDTKDQRPKTKGL